MNGRRSGRLSVAGMIAMPHGSRTRLCHRLVRHPAGDGKRRSMGEKGSIALYEGVQHLIEVPIVLVWNRLGTHVSRRIRKLIERREWLTVFLLPACSPDLNSVEPVWAQVKHSLAGLADVALGRLKVLVRNRLERLRCRPGLLGGFVGGTGFAFDSPTPR
ncbi:transposase [Streptomyces monashensis]